MRAAGWSGPTPGATSGFSRGASGGGRRAGPDPTRLQRLRAIDERRDLEVQGRPHAERCEVAGRRADGGLQPWLRLRPRADIARDRARARRRRRGRALRRSRRDGAAAQADRHCRVAEPEPSARSGIAFLGDSTCDALRRRRERLSIIRLGPALDELAPGSPSLPDVLVRLRPASPSSRSISSRTASRTCEPDAVVLAFNLASFSNQWREADRPELAAWLPVRHLGEALAAAAALDRALDRRAAALHGRRRAGGFEAWRSCSHEQARCVRAWESLRQLAASAKRRAGWPRATRPCIFFQRRQAQYVPGPPERETRIARAFAARRDPCRRRTRSPRAARAASHARGLSRARDSRLRLHRPAERRASRADRPAAIARACAAASRACVAWWSRAGPR